MIKFIIKYIQNLFDWSLDWSITDKEIDDNLNYGRDR